MSLVALFGALAVAVTIVQFAPQAFRVQRSGVAGVAVGTWALFTCTTAAWLSYGIVAHQLSLTLVNLVVGPLAWSILARLALVPKNRARALAAFGAAALCAAITALYPTVSVFVLAAVEVVAIVPQLLEVFKPIDLSGVSVATWLATAFAQSLWGIYGIVASQLAVSLGGFAGGALAVGIALRLGYLTKHAKPSAPEKTSPKK